VTYCPRCGHEPSEALGPAGSTIDWFTCPACRFVWADRAAAGEEISVEAAKPGSKHVVVADDDPTVLRLVARALSDYRVSLARDGHEALAIVRNEHVDLLIADYLMPSMTGQELVDTCEGEGATFPVLVLTGYGDILERVEPAWWAARSHLAKPVRIHELRTTVQRLIGDP
jgi:CheY-like chemotaxis protein